MFSKVYVLKYKNIKDKLNSKQASTTAGYSTYDIYYTLIMGVILINFWLVMFLKHRLELMGQLLSVLFKPGRLK